MSSLDLGEPPDERRGVLSQATQVVFFDSAVENYQVLRQGLNAGVDSVVLDSAGDGLKEMAAFLASRHGLTLVGVVAHGGPGTIALGAANLNVESLGYYTRELATVGSALARGGQLDLWSCCVGAGQLGAAFVRELAADTTAAVAASTHPIGAAALGGNWQLDVRSGGPASKTPFSGHALASFQGVLGAWSLAGALITARYGQTATLLNNGKVLVTGGHGLNGPLSSAELYDPTTNTWSAAGFMATTRTDHTATLLGNGKVLVTGGYSGGPNGQILATAELYDPVANSWSGAGFMADARDYPAATLLENGEVLVTGGYGSKGPLASAELYDPMTNSWSVAGSMATARAEHTATLISNGKVLVAGGAVIKSAELYDPATNTWVVAGSMPSASQHHTATLLSNGKVLIAGGDYNASLYDPFTNSWSSGASMATLRDYPTAVMLNDGLVLVAGGGGNNDQRSLSSAELYDPRSNTWSFTGPMTTGRQVCTATLLNNGQVLVVGGYGPAGILSSTEIYDSALPTPPSAWTTTGPVVVGQVNPTATLLGNGKVLVTAGGTAGAELYDAATNTWSSAGKMSVSRIFATATLLANGKVLIAGGEGGETDDVLSSAELYDPVSNSWSSAGSMLSAHVYHSATLLPNGKVLVAGGPFSSSAELYDPITNSWSAAGSMKGVHYSDTATLLPNGQVLVTGGIDDTSHYTASAELYDPATDTWSLAAPMSGVRGYQTATLLPDGKVLVTGGDSNSGTIQASAELYDPATNTWSAAASMAVGRATQTATLLNNGKVLVAGGGMSRSDAVFGVSSAELYDPATNSWSSAGSMAAVHQQHAAALLNNGEVLIVGGYPNPASAELYLADGFAITPLGGTTAMAGTPFAFTVQAIDPFGNPLKLNGPTRVTIASSPAAGQGAFPITGTLDSSGFGVFLGNLNTAGAYRLTATAGSLADTSGTITVTPAAASFFSVTATATATTGSGFDVTVKAFDHFGNLATGYSGRVHFTSTDASANLPADATLAGGLGTFHVTLNTAGSQTITATDAVSTNPTITGASSPITVRGLTIAALIPTSTGFTLSFSKPIVAADIYLYGGTIAKPIQNVTLIGTATGPIFGRVNGSFVIDPSGLSATFKASSDWLANIAGPASGVLPNDTWTVTLQSGTGAGASANGFFDALGAALDGANNGGQADYSTTFTTAYDGKPALTIPDFARGPDDASIIKAPNNSASGIPVTLANAPVGTKDVVFTLTYNPTLFTATGAGTGDSSGTGSSFTVGSITPVDASHAQATFSWHNDRGLGGDIVLGDILATVPNSAANQYGAKELLVLGAVTLNGVAFTGITSPAVHVNAYFGDLSGDGQLTGLDLATAGLVATGTPAAPIGLSAYQLVDPALIGDIGGDGSIDAAAISSLAAWLAHVTTPALPTPPAGLTIAPGGPDPMLSLGRPPGYADDEEAGRIGNPSYVTVAVLLDQAKPAGSTGMTEAILGLTYDPKVLTVSAADIALGSIPASGSGWRLESVIDPLSGQIAMDVYSTTPITVDQAGSLATITFHVVPGPRVAGAAVQLVSSVTPNGQWFKTEVADGKGQFVLSPGLDSFPTPIDPERAAWGRSMRATRRLPERG